jgi:hypothetical protein
MGRKVRDARNDVSRLRAARQVLDMVIHGGPSRRPDKKSLAGREDPTAAPPPDNPGYGRWPAMNSYASLNVPTSITVMLY